MEKELIQPRNPIDRKNDSWFNMIDNIPMATHFYYLNKTMIQSSLKDLAPFSQSGQVLSLLYMPFLEEADISLFKIPYDEEYYGTVKPDATSPTDYLGGINVYKIGQYIGNPKQIGTFKRYPDSIKQKDTSRKKWQNESKLFQYPYHYINVCDYINTPLQIINNLLPSTVTTDIALKVSQPISVTGGYTMYVEGYKGDKTGVNEGILANSCLDLPTSSSQYSQFMATSKASFVADNQISRRNQDVSSQLATKGYENAIANSLGNIFSLPQAVSGVYTGYNQLEMQGIQLKNERQNFIDQANAKISDLMTAPRNVSLSSSDILMTLNRNKRKVVANRYHIREEYLNKLCDYFTLYGYKQNRMMEVNYDSRKYFNYVKTIDANILPKDSSLIDKEEIEEIKEIFNSGITWWHHFRCEQDNVKMFDYSKDNTERFI